MFDKLSGLNVSLRMLSISDRVLPGSKRGRVEQQGHRTIVHRSDLHVGTELTMLHMEAAFLAFLHEELIQRHRDVRLCRIAEARAAAL